MLEIEHLVTGYGGVPVLQVRRTALTFGDKPVEYRISTVNTAQHDYVSLLSRPA